jgi:hypothetical protein
MIRLEQTTKYRCDTENEAKEQIENFRNEAREKGYLIKKIGYEYKNKKAKGEIIDECYVLSVTAIYADMWEI